MRVAERVVERVVETAVWKVLKRVKTPAELKVSWLAERSETLTAV